METTKIKIDGAEKSSQFLLRDINQRMSSPMRVPLKEIDGLMDLFKKGCLLPFFRKYEQIRGFQIRVGLGVGDYIIIGLRNDSLWSTDIVKGLEEYLDITYKRDYGLIKYNDGDAMFEKGFKINNTMKYMDWKTWEEL